MARTRRPRRRSCRISRHLRPRPRDLLARPPRVNRVASPPGLSGVRRPPRHSHPRRRSRTRCHRTRSSLRAARPTSRATTSTGRSASCCASSMIRPPSLPRWPASARRRTRSPGLARRASTRIWSCASSLRAARRWRSHRRSPPGRRTRCTPRRSSAATRRSRSRRFSRTSLSAWRSRANTSPAPVARTSSCTSGGSRRGRTSQRRRSPPATATCRTPRPGP
mmetsp:Transcript_51569/g.158913  ORF Transcript_51569/g.158913 Transcript_51569/m.158913 type:complete len:222 (+) Transcript_51569:886-1551(+)